MQKKSAQTSKNIFIASAILTALFLSGCSTQDSPVNTQTTGQNNAVNTQTSSEIQKSLSPEASPQIQTTILKYSPDMIKQRPQLFPPQKGDTIAIIDTDFGTMKMKLFVKQVPELTKNFIELAKAKKYTNVPFHRVVKDFMIQTGDFTNGNGTGGYSYKGLGNDLPNEIVKEIVHLYGTVSMAKTMAPVSIGSQFFIVTNKQGTSFLDGKYSPIGQVYEGMEVAEAIQNLEVEGTEHPSQIVNVKSITITKFESATEEK